MYKFIEVLNQNYIRLFTYRQKFRICLPQVHHTSKKQESNNKCFFNNNIHFMKIYSPPDNHVLSKILFTARISNTAIQHEVVPYGHKNKQFQEHHSLFTSPSLEVSPGKFVFGTHSIMRTIAPQTQSLTPFQQAEINQWFELIEKQLEPAVGVIILNNNELTQVKEAQIAKAKDVIIKVAKALDDRLKLNTFLVGDSLTIADISAYFSWNEVCSSLEKEAKHFLNLHRWANQIGSIPLK